MAPSSLAHFVLPSLALASPAAAQTVQEFLIPRANAFPHDPAVSADGTVWYTDQANSYIGRLDPATGAITDRPTPTPNSGPHGITVAPDGFVWYTAQSVGRLGRVDPVTFAITDYPLPANANRPHTPLWHQGAIWFTAQSNQTYGRFDPVTLTAQVFPAPANSLPYGLAAAPDGHLWIALFGTNQLGRVDPANGALQLFPLPNASARPRRLDVSNDGMVWYTDYARGYLGRLDPASGAVQEWLAPDPPPGPYGISSGTDGRVWFHAAGTAQMLAFDPRTQQFGTVAIPTAGAIVRHMVTDWPRGRLWLALSGTRRIGLVQLAPAMTPIGGGCAGAAGVATMVATGLPRIGASVTFAVANSTAPVGALMYGFSSATWNGTPLPIGLGGFGAAGCFVHVALDIATVLVPPAPVTVAVPVDQSLNGFTWFAQWALLLDPSGVPIVTTDAVGVRVIGI
jgi:virginiamycin B lyase